MFTGETGAGKSIFVNALNLLGGSRLNSNIVGTRSDETKIEGVFTFTKGSHGYQKCLEYEFDPEEDCVFSRTISVDGKSVYRINRQVVTLGIVRDILANEIDIHSQFDTTYLKDESTHLQLIDEFHMQTDLLESVAMSYRRIEEVKAEKRKFEKSLLNESQREFLRFQIKEIEALKLSINEELEVNETLEMMSHFEANHSHFTQAQDRLTALDSTPLYQAIESLKQVQSSDPKLINTIEMLESSYYQLEEAVIDLNHLIDKESFDPYEFERLQERSYQYAKIKRKYQKDVIELINLVEKGQKQLADLEHQDLILHEYDTKIANATKDFETLAEALTQVRVDAANSLKNQIEKQLNDLMLPHAQFDVEFYPNRSSRGLQDCRFLISVNKGQPLQPLSKTASGGELSRFMLGMKVIFNQLQHIECVVFDEIDTGISGPVALQVGLKMSELAKSCLVITVTHLPAVASCGDAHYVVEKTNDDIKTMVHIRKLDDNHRLRELAQMAFTNTNESSIMAAKDLLTQAKQAKLHE